MEIVLFLLHIIKVVKLAHVLTVALFKCNLPVLLMNLCPVSSSSQTVVIVLSPSHK